ncbi:MAG TPA: hypothetical protein VF077_09725 [Nitrospiraceae bacterium]
MECLLCAMWNKMPYGKRYTTPTTVGETEGALVIGYWIAARRDPDVVVGLCERHMAVVNNLDAQEERRKALEVQRAEAVKAAEARTRPNPTADPHFQQRLAEVNQQKEMLVASVPAPVPTQQLASPSSAPIILGPTPLPLAPPPPVATIETGFLVPQLHNQGQPISLEPHQAQGHQAPALIDAPCLFCKTMVLQGEVHNCPQAGAKGN